jgi:lipopolysaccharide/colanic/teichoic acid biosynthesis glycosyltransferase
MSSIQADDLFETTLEVYWRAALARSVQHRVQFGIKRLVDLVLATLMLLLLSPVCLAIAIAIKLTSSGPVLYRQRRVGKDWQEFTLLKFRTMVEGADTMRDSVAALNQANGPLFKARNDPRVTAVGRIIRSIFLDEVPQLINVIRGDMSLVGPRPCLAEEIATIEEAMYFRFAVPQGITGPWQTNGYHALPFRDQLAVELDYVQGWSLTRDLSILARTIPIVIKHRGS